jgi:adenine-specific DNA-methyltransferase
MKKEKINIKIDKNIEILKNNFPSCFDKNGNFNIEKFQKEISENELNLSKESYGLEWLGKSYARVRTFDPTQTLLKENEEWNEEKENKNSQNLLIKGDNLEVLKHLSNSYDEKIKMIYIDPPYNTGNEDFVYNDDRKFSINEFMELAGVDEERAKRVLEFVDSKNNSHSAWLTFMYPRLYIARKLLKDDGIIFISIDDNEVAQLRLLMDEIFGEENFVESFVWDKKNSAKGVPPKNMVVNIHEYILCYTKSENGKLLGEKRTKESFSNPDNDPRGEWRLSNIKSTLNNKNKFIITDPKTGNEFENFWAFSEKRLNEMIIDNRIIFPKKKTGLPKQKEFFNEFKNKNIPIKSNLGLFDAQDSYERIVEKMLGAKVFPYRKPTKLLKKLISQAGDEKDIIILDFFAGSGTTGDAVMQLNAEDRGKRKFILVQLPEEIDPKKNKTAYDFVKNELKIENPTIFDITKERLIRTAKKIKENLPNHNIDTSFKIFETSPLWEDYLVDEKELNNQTKLFEVNKLSNEDLKALLTTWKSYDGLPLTQNYQEIKLDDYTAYYCWNILYFMNDNFKTDNIKTLLEKIDNDKKFVIDKIVIFGYNFDSVILREIEENIRNYSNKKNIEIETIIRF